MDFYDVDRDPRPAARARYEEKQRNDREREEQQREAESKRVARWQRGNEDFHRVMGGGRKKKERIKGFLTLKQARMLAHRKVGQKCGRLNTPEELAKWWRRERDRWIKAETPLFHRKRQLEREDATKTPEYEKVNNAYLEVQQMKGYIARLAQTCADRLRKQYPKSQNPVFQLDFYRG